MTRPNQSSTSFVASRAAGLERLEEFAPQAAGHYRNERNFDYGSEKRDNISNLSPYIRHRLISEREVCAAVLREASLSENEKFIQEVFWRTYWKGWLEMRPGVWAAFLDQRDLSIKALSDDLEMKKRFDNAVNGFTGIDCFDAWTKELVDTGYLHNHARMWFASIWIFTLKLDWTLGADFFLRHLLDADPASNTLSWRWVAGLQTKGKHYVATAWNIEKFTGGRFQPKGLNEAAEPTPDDFAFDPPLAPPVLEPLPMTGNALLLIHGDDCSSGIPISNSIDVTAVATWYLENSRSPLDIGEQAASFSKGALIDIGHRAAAQHETELHHFTDLDAIEQIISCAKETGADYILTAYAPVGWTRAGLDKLKLECGKHELGFFEHRRDWDTVAWPHAKKGFFPFKKNIPSLLRDAGLT